MRALLVRWPDSVIAAVRGDIGKIESAHWFPHRRGVMSTQGGGSQPCDFRRRVDRPVLAPPGVRVGVWAPALGVRVGVWGARMGVRVGVDGAAMFGCCL